MKKLALLVMLGIVSQSHAVVPYVQGGAGVNVGGGSMKPGALTEVRYGVEHGLLDASFGYLRGFTQTDYALLPGDLDMHTLSGELFIKIPVPHVSVKLGGGFGYTIPNLTSKGTEKLDNDISGTLGGKVELPLTSKLSIGVSARYFAFNTDSHRTTMVTESETIYQKIHGHKIPIGTVETETPSYSDNSINFNSVNVMASLVYRF